MAPHRSTLLLQKVRPKFLECTVAEVYACTGHISILEWMLHHSLATGLEKDEYGSTPVHDAAEQGQLECLHVFYNHSVSLCSRDADELTPRCGPAHTHTHNTPVLADLYMKPVYPLVSRDLAEEKGHHECVAFLTNPDKELQRWKQKHQLQEAPVSKPARTLSLFPPSHTLSLTSLPTTEGCNARLAPGALRRKEEEIAKRTVLKEKGGYSQ